ncbi:MAG: thioesterase family protein [Pseudomonadota bacterium]
MNLWVRFLWLILSAWRRLPLTGPTDPSVLRFRVLPTDVDINIHLTNGRYQAIADLGRMDMAVRSGLFRRVLREGWAPIVSFSSVLFRRELRLWQRYELTSQIIWWDDEIQVFEHAFRPIGGRHDGEIAAVILCVASMYDRRAKRFIPPGEMLETLDWVAESPAITPRIAAFVADYRAFRQESRAQAIAA